MRQATPQYRIIFNWDGAPLDYDEHPQSTDRLVEQVYGPLEGTQVDAMFWSIGSHEAEWPSEVHERLGDGEGRVYSSMRAKRHSENIRSMFERGENPFQAMVDRGHELGIDVYVSMRMNDNHFYGTRPEDFKRLNGAQSSGKTIPNGCWTSTTCRSSGASGHGTWPYPRRRSINSRTFGRRAFRPTGTALSSTGRGTRSTCRRTTGTGCAMP